MTKDQAFELCNKVSALKRDEIIISAGTVKLENDNYKFCTIIWVDKDLHQEQDDSKRWGNTVGERDANFIIVADKGICIREQNYELALGYIKTCEEFLNKTYTV